MTNPPLPPTGVTEYLSELAQYYRDLVAYHQQAAIAASQQLGHVEALLRNTSQLPQQEVQSWLIDEESSSTVHDDLEESEISETFETLEGVNGEQEEILTSSSHNHPENEAITNLQEKENGEQEEILTSSSHNHPENEAITKPQTKELSPISMSQVRELFEKERGTMLHFDYIVHHFYGPISESQKQQILPSISELLRVGSLQHKWAKVPDAPNCWTLTLLDFRDLAAKKNDNSSVSKIPPNVLPTPKVAHLLSINREKIYELKNLYPDTFVEGVDYFRNSRNHFFWAESGIDKLKEFLRQIKSQKKTYRHNKFSDDNSMLPEYKGLSRQQAVEKFFKENPDKAVNINDITKAIYGDLKSTQAPKIREGIIKALSAGKSKGLWTNVPGVMGVYRAKKH